MTLVAAWIRLAGNGEELVIVSDSRVTGGIALNHAPKLFPLDRNDAVLAYCGPTVVAYPLLLQIKASLNAHEETKTRVIDITDLKSHIEKTIELLRAPIEDLPSGDNTHRAFKFLLAGYSWKQNQFRAWMFRYDIETRKFNAFSMPRSNRRFIFMSDDKKNESLATKILMNELRSLSQRPRKLLNWEPLDALIRIINDKKINDIGGPPQIIKVYKHANILPINALWPLTNYCFGTPFKAYEITHLGRPLLGYERTRLLTMNLDTKELIEPWKIREFTNCVNEIENKNALRMVLLNIFKWMSDRKLLQETLTRRIKNGESYDDLKRELGF
jgi:hypothetical protein